MKCTLVFVTAMAATALTGAVVAAPTATLTIRYAGSTTQIPTALATNGFVTNGSGFSPNQFLSYAPPEINSSTAYVHYYDVGLTFTPETYTNGVSNETFRSAKINIVLSPELQFVSPQGISGTTAQKYFGFDLTNDLLSSAKVFATNSDSDAAGDLQGIEILQDSAAISAGSQVGVGDVTGFGITWNGGKAIPVPTYVGRFGVKATGPLPIEGGLPVLATSGGEFTYFVNNNIYNSVFDNNSYVSNPAGLIGMVPEPGTVGIVVLGLGIMSRRWRRCR